jgi:hypothetical protein
VAQKNVYTFTCKIKSKECIHFLGPLCIYMGLLVKPEILTSYIYMDLRLATLKAVSFYLLHNVSTLKQCTKFSCGTVVCKHFAGYQDYPNYKRDFFGSLRVNGPYTAYVFTTRKYRSIVI